MLSEAKPTQTPVRKTPLIKSMVAVSALAFLAGLPFPMAASLLNPYMGYGIVFISIPVWTIGVLTGAIATIAIRTDGPNALLARWLASGLLLLNAAAIGLVLLTPFHAS